MVEVLLDAGASLRTRDVTGMTPLLCAAYHCQPDVVQLLLARGADPAAVDHVRPPPPPIKPPPPPPWLL